MVQILFILRHLLNTYELHSHLLHTFIDKAGAARGINPEPQLTFTALLNRYVEIRFR
jgi:hypothetical protein